MLSLTENTPGSTPAIVISEPSAEAGTLKIDLARACVFTANSTPGATGLTYENPGSPTTSQYATTDLWSPNDSGWSLQATLPGDDLTLGAVSDPSTA